MEEATREQQREARRQKVLARTQDGGRVPVIDLATQQNEIAPQGAMAELDQADQDSSLVLGNPSGVGADDAAAASAEDSSKSASRLAAERRRQRILSRSTERMAKVQGGRVKRGADEGGEGGDDGGGESLDDVSLERPVSK